MDGKHSEWKPMLAGVPQGSTLSPIPILYSLYTSDILKSTTRGLAIYDICIYDKNHRA